MTAALVLDGTPDAGRLVRSVRASVEERAADAAASHGTGLGLGHARWVHDEQFDVTDHVRRVGAPGDASFDAVLAMAAESATAPFDPARPLWDATLVTGVSRDAQSSCCGCTTPSQMASGRSR